MGAGGRPRVMDGVANLATAGLALRATPNIPDVRATNGAATEADGCTTGTHQPRDHTRPFLPWILWARWSSSHGPGNGCSMGLSHLRTVVPFRPWWCPPGHLHWDRLFLFNWNNALSNALMQGNHQGIRSGLVWPGSSLSAGLSQGHLGGLLRQGHRTQHLVRLIHLHGRDTAPSTAQVSHRARPAPAVAALGWVEPVAATKLLKWRRQANESGLWEIRYWDTGVSVSSQKTLKETKTRANYNGIQHKKIIKHGIFLEYFGQRIPPSGNDHQICVLPSSSKCWHPDGAASSDLLTWSPWQIIHHKSSKPWQG